MNVSVNILLKPGAYAALRNVVYDIETLIRRIDLTQLPPRISVSFHNGDRLSSADVAEIMLSFGMTASQVAYMRDGEGWSPIDAKEGSAEGLTIVNRLDDLREKIAGRMHEFHTLKHKQYVTNLTRRAFSARCFSSGCSSCGAYVACAGLVRALVGDPGPAR